MLIWLIESLMGLSLTSCYTSTSIRHAANLGLAIAREKTTLRSKTMRDTIEAKEVETRLYQASIQQILADHSTQYHNRLIG